MSDSSWVCDNAKVYGDAEISGNAVVCNNAKVYDDAMIFNDAMIFDDAIIYDYAMVSGNAEIHGNARISDIDDYIVFKNTWSSGHYFTYTLSNDMWSVEHFYGTGQELIKEAYADSETSGKHYKAYVNFVETVNYHHLHFV